MANETRQRQLGIGGLVEDASLSAGATQFTSAGLANITGGVDSSHHMAIILGPDGDVFAPEIAYITALTAGASTTGTTGLLRGQEGSTAQAWPQDTPWVHGPTLRDMFRAKSRQLTGAAGITTTSTTMTPVDSTNLPFLTFTNCEVGDIIVARFTCTGYNLSSAYVRFDAEVDQPTSANVYMGQSFGAGDGLQQIFGSNTNSIKMEGRFIVTERGTHGFRPVWKVSAGTGGITTGGTNEDNAATFVAEYHGPETD